MKIRSYLLGILALLAVMVVTPPVSAAETVNNFTISQYQIDYFLGQDGDQRSTLKTTERITTVFPDNDQNHGIERAIPRSYDSHPVTLKIDSITDGAGTSIPFTTYRSNGNEIIRIGDADRFVHGTQNYVLNYSQRDTTRYFANTARDEFYWDTNGTGWSVPINSLTVTLHIDSALSKRLAGEQFCYFGPSGATNRCPIIKVDDSFVSSTSDLQAGENMTLAVGFQPQTFAAYHQSVFEKLAGIWRIGLAVTAVLAAALAVYSGYNYNRISNRTKELGTIIPEYLPPKGVSLSVAASIAGKSRSLFSAQLLDLAVRHYLKLYQTRPKSLFRPADYELEIVADIADLSAEEQELVRDIFNDTAVGSRLTLSSLRNNSSVAKNISDNTKKLQTDITGNYGLQAPQAAATAWFKRLAWTSFALGIISLSPWLILLAFACYICARSIKPLTDDGLQLARYLKGLEQYISVAETERLRYLQSPEGAIKLDAPIDTNDRRQLVKLYERVLPYAVLFGQEKQWNKRLGEYYESLNEQPSWYGTGNGVFNAVVFSSAMNSFSTASTYTSAGSSSSGGSGGGGSSGGGGGGGGGGGW